MYQKYLSPYRDKHLKMLEIGLGCDMVRKVFVLEVLLVLTSSSRTAQERRFTPGSNTFHTPTCTS